MPKQLRTLLLKDIRFTQDSIANDFGDYTFEETAAALRDGRLEMGDNEGQLPRIKVIVLGGFHFSLDNRRLYCLLLAFENEPLKEVEVWEQDMNRTIEKELVWKFSTGLSLNIRGEDKGYRSIFERARSKGRGKGKAKSGGASASEFLARHLTGEQIEAARDAVREEYEQELARLKQIADEKDRLLTGYRQDSDVDDDIAQQVLEHLWYVGYANYASILLALPRPPSMLQLKRVLKQLVRDQSIRCKGPNEDSLRYGSARSPWANSELEIGKEYGLWTITSSVAKLSHPDITGESLSKQGAYIGCTLSLDIIGPQACGVIRLSGDWCHNDKLLFGVWPASTSVDDLFRAPAPNKRDVDSMQPAPGWWISCSSGYLLSDGNRFSPLDWKPPPLGDGTRWGLILSASGQLWVTAAHSGQPLDWSALKWNGNPNWSLDPSGCAIAVLLQPHNRRGSKAQVVVEKVGYEVD